MKVIKTVNELKTLIKKKVLPAYEAAYADEDSDFEELCMGTGICGYANDVLNIWIYDIMDDVLCSQNKKGFYIAVKYRLSRNREQTILPRIEWMRKFIKE